MFVSGYCIQGTYPLDGEITVQGAKNAVLPILAATIINGGRNVIHNCPKLRDVEKTIDILEALGCKVLPLGNTIVVDSGPMDEFVIKESLMRQMRSSIFFLGAIIARCGEAVVSMPGGCEIGMRPVDLHLKGLKMLGIDITEENGYIICKANKLHGAKIHLDFPSVGATENIILAAVAANGTTIITNAAREPEIVDLQNFLCRMGASVKGAGTDTVVIEGGKRLYGVDYTIMPDRIAAGTYLTCCGAAGGSVFLKNVSTCDMTSMLSVLTNMGAKIKQEKNSLHMTVSKRLKSFGTVRTMPYPGFPTDIQSPFLALACLASGTSVIVETIFENRFRNAEELVRMGADIRVDGKTAVVIGTKRLHGARVCACELRGGASLVAAALGAEGTTIVTNVEYIDRGYENFEKNLTSCGAYIKRISEE